MKPTFFTANMKLADIIHADYRLLVLLPRFGLNLGFGDKTVKECCEKNQIPASFFVMICNIYAFERYLPDSREIETIDIEQLISYLLKSHDYYLHNRIQGIYELLQAIAENCEQQHRKILNRFFEEYQKEVVNHFNYEEKTVFPYIQNVIRGEQYTGYDIGIFGQNHSNIDDKLNDLKNIVIKYLPGDAMLQEKITMLSNIFSLEEDLNRHVLIEDKILIPLVRKLEDRYGKQ